MTGTQLSDECWVWRVVHKSVLLLWCSAARRISQHSVCRFIFCVSHAYGLWPTELDAIFLKLFRFRT